MHALVVCTHCRFEFSKNNIESHQANCTSRPAECSFCLLNISYKDKFDHEYICGSKTELCVECKKYIQIKNYDSHKAEGCYPEDIYLNQHINVDAIPILVNKKKTKIGNITNAVKIGLINKNPHKELDNKIKELEKLDVKKEIVQGKEKNIQVEIYNNNKTDKKTPKILQENKSVINNLIKPNNTQSNKINIIKDDKHNINIKKSIPEHDQIKAKSKNKNKF